MKGPGPFHLLPLRPHGMGEDWEALPFVCNQNRTKIMKLTQQDRLCDLWTDDGQRVDQLRARGSCTGGDLSAWATLTSHIREASLRSHIPHTYP